MHPLFVVVEITGSRLVVGHLYRGADVGGEGEGSLGLDVGAEGSGGVG